MLRGLKIQAFTLIEIIVVVIILGGIATLALPNFMNLVEANRAEEAKHKLQVLLGAQKRYYLDNNSQYANALSRLDVTILESTAFLAPVANPNSPAKHIARITKRGGLYTLYIQEDGTLLCRSATNKCPKIGAQSCTTLICGGG